MRLKYQMINISIIMLIFLNQILTLQSQDNFVNGIQTNQKDTEFVSNTDQITDDELTTTNNEIFSTRQNAITKAVAKCSPAVVGISVTEVRKISYRDPLFDDPFFHYFFGGRSSQRSRQYEVQGLGTGFLISEDGYILTNHHVAGNASKIVVTMTNGTKYDAEIIGSDNVSDVALIKIKGENLPYLNLSNSDNVIIGEWAIAFGNPFGLFDINAKPTVTVGVVSNKGVNLSTDNKVYKGMIQSDAAISSGNSGGPLVNSLGEVIGMNTVIFSTAQDQNGAGSIGIGFSIPINRVKTIIDLLKKNKTINRNFVVGMEVREIDERISHYLKTNIKEGVVIFSINRKSPSEEAGFEPGDIILNIDGNNVQKLDDYYVMINDGIAGQNLEFSVLRNGEILKKTLHLKPL